MPTPLVAPTALAALAAAPPALVGRPGSWTVGWALVLVGFLSGAALGLGFHRADFLGGYASPRRRLVRLGHVALVALGMLNVLHGLAPPSGAAPAAWAGGLLAAGGVLMPAACFLVAWRAGLRPVFALPVAALVAAVVLVLIGGAA